MPKHACLMWAGPGAPIKVVSMAGARTSVNGVVAEAGIEVALSNMDRLIFGNNSVFKVVVNGEGWEGDDVDWEVAMKEANSELLKAMSAVNTEKEEEGEREIKEMGDKVKELEEQLRSMESNSTR